MAFVSPYLLEHALTRAHMAVVMLAAPVSGLLVQSVIGTRCFLCVPPTSSRHTIPKTFMIDILIPVPGALADNSTSKRGRRRPYMLFGSVPCSFSLTMLSYARELAA